MSYLEAMDRIVARESLISVNELLIGTNTAKNARSLLNEIRRRARRHSPKKATPAQLKGIGIGVKRARKSRPSDTGTEHRPD